MCLLTKIAEVSIMAPRGARLESLEGHIRNLLGVDMMASLCLMDRTDRVISSSDQFKGTWNTNYKVCTCLTIVSCFPATKGGRLWHSFEDTSPIKGSL